TPGPKAGPPRLPHAAPALLLLLTALATSLACQQLWTHDDDTFPGDALRLLQDMAPAHTQPCHLQELPFFPETLPLNNLHPRQAAATALRILQHLFHTLSTNSTRQHWPAQPRNDLLNKLQHHIHRLEQCLPDSVRYFRDIQLFLHAHNHSACAWDHIRLEARAALQHLHSLARTMRR
uniref:IFN protein n=1 Tax=Catharus ustulatus TaxID=91951 RepID=A0A8C3UZE2_CATUS